MTDEEQKKLRERLRRLELERDVGVKAADEIERLNLELRHEHDVRAEVERGCVNMAKEIERLAALAQSDAEPVAIGELEALINSEDDEKCVILPNGQVVRESHPEWEDFAPPRPDASAGLIEAAEMADEEAAKTDGLKGWELMKFAKLLRARAVDRSGK